MALEIKNAADITSPWTAWFLYGDSGAGKTHAAATFPAPFFICPSNEGSIHTLQGMDVPFVEVDGRQKMFEIISYLENQMDKLLKGDEDAFPWETIVVESLSHYCDLLIEDISARGMKKMDMQGWGHLTNHLRTIHARLRNLEVHVVYTSLVKTGDDGTGSPMMTGQMALKMPSACDYIGYCEAMPQGLNKPTTYRVNFRQAGKFPARARQSPVLVQRHGKFPDFIDDFHFSKAAPFIGLGHLYEDNKQQESSDAESHSHAVG